MYLNSNQIIMSGMFCIEGGSRGTKGFGLVPIAAFVYYKVLSKVLICNFASVRPKRGCTEIKNTLDMIAFANAKINLGLHITGKRPDGYHLLESVFVPIPLCDILELQPIQGQADRLKVLGNIATGDDADNLVIRAIRALRSRCDFPGVEVILKKQIPSGAGLGGGSADASTTLRMLRETFALEISDEDLEGIALSLGADCPFFVRNTPRLVEGIGEVFRPAPRLDIGHYNLVVVKPDLHVSTGEAFRGLSRIGGHAEHVSAIVASPIETWRGRLVNDFEASLFPT